MRLQDKFKRVFIFPLICGIVLSILLTVMILALYALQFSDNDLVNRLQSVENDKTLPIIQTTKNMLYKKFQQSIYAIELFYKFYSDLLQDDVTNTQKDFINKYSINVLSLSNKTNLDMFVDCISQDSNCTLCSVCPKISDNTTNATYSSICNQTSNTSNCINCSNCSYLGKFSL